MLVIARTTGVQTVVMNGDSNTHESHDSVGDAENARLENAGPKCKGGQCRSI